MRLRTLAVRDAVSKTKCCSRTTRHAPSERVFGYCERATSVIGMAEPLLKEEAYVCARARIRDSYIKGGNKS